MMLIAQPLIAELSTITAFLGNGIVLAAVVGMVGLAWKQGLFVVTAVALGCLAAFVGAMAGVGPVGRLLIDVEVPASLAAAAAYFFTLAGLLLALRAACGQWLPEQALWMGKLPSRLASCYAGGIAGAILAAALLVGWTMLPLPASLALRPGELFWDPGPWALKVFARCVESNRQRREALLGMSTSGGGAMGSARSEPFFDANGNCIRDDDERFLDRDGNAAFTKFEQTAGDAAELPPWQPGLLDHYRLAAWKRVMVLHAPRIRSEAIASVDAAALGEGLYRALVADPDACDTPTFSLEADGAERDDPPLTIDPQTGVVELSEAELESPRKKYSFTVTAVDKAGLSHAMPVTVTIKGLPDPPVTP